MEIASTEVDKTKYLITYFINKIIYREVEMAFLLSVLPLRWSDFGQISLFSNVDWNVLLH